MKTVNEYRAMFEADRNAARETVKEWRKAAELLDTIQATDVVEGTPEDTVKAFVEEVGADMANFIVASLVNRSAWDGRISGLVKVWAEGIAEALDEDAAGAAMVTTKMHMAHLDQVARAMMNYKPEPEQIDETTAAMLEEADEILAKEVAEEMAAQAETESGKESATPAFTITHNPQFNSLEISFDGKPSEEIRNALKGLKFRWHNVKKVWYGYADEAKVTEAINAAAAPLVIPESKFIDGGGLYDGWAGGNARTWHTDKELKAFLMADFKKAGIAASVRFGRGGYLTSLTVTIKIAASEIKSFEEWKAEDNDRIFWGSFPWINYVDEFGTTKTIHKEEAYNMKGEEGEKVREACRKCTYEYKVSRLTDSGSTPDPEVLTKDAAAKLDTVKAIVGSYNRDCSNGMIDYFDRDIYDNYSFKIA